MTAPNRETGLKHREKLLGVNIDHIATLRQVRGEVYPDPVNAAAICLRAGADSITVHLREDRRHIQDRDVRLLKEVVDTRLNLEMAATADMVRLALEVKPHQVTLVPEKREELTTEGGLDVAGQIERIKQHTATLRDSGIEVSMFIEADRAQVEASLAAGANAIEIHTGIWAQPGNPLAGQELARIGDAARYADGQGLVVNAGHGLHYHNVLPLAAIAEINEFNIGHAIVARAVFDGLASAVRDMKQLLARGARAA